MRPVTGAIHILLFERIAFPIKEIFVKKRQTEKKQDSLHTHVRYYWLLCNHNKIIKHQQNNIIFILSNFYKVYPKYHYYNNDGYGQHSASKFDWVIILNAANHYICHVYYCTSYSTHHQKDCLQYTQAIKCVMI